MYCNLAKSTDTPLFTAKSDLKACNNELTTRYVPPHCFKRFTKFLSSIVQGPSFFPCFYILKYFLLLTSQFRMELMKETFIFIITVKSKYIYEHYHRSKYE